MKKVFVTAIALLMFSLAVFSQKNPGKYYLTVSAGPSLPLGKFANKNALADRNGLAIPGETLNVLFTFFSDNGLGLALELRGQRNAIDPAGVSETIGQVVLRDFILVSTTSPRRPSYSVYSDWKVQEGTWWTASTSFGLALRKPLSSSGNLLLSGKILAGGMYVKAPSVDARSITEEKAYEIERSGRSLFGFAWSGGIGLILDKKKSLFFTGGVDYVGSNNLNIHDVKARIAGRFGKDGDSNTGYSDTKFITNRNQVISCINATVGVGVRL
ncbi:MAG: hypothetical protein JNK79_10580 [Chitinophagaceae bacterium]|nr:hypothetical protein [Chitinophagaceae bacterium]